ncbi:MAG TPA: phosphodiester glycosidase family protein [Acidimicrobiales bacterium]|nr:phosphodiester glycosidase family protein [Acidimicrobiales bacterium]
MTQLSVVGAERRRGRRSVVPALVVLWVLGTAGPAQAAVDVPGYRTEEVRSLAPGVEYRRLVRADGPVVVHVVALEKGSGHVLRAVLSNDRVAGPAPAQERTTAMCQRVRCVAAVNGDFAFPSGEPIGAVVAGGQMLRSPVPSHHQLSVTPAGDLVAGTLGWSAQLVPSDLRPLPLQGLNVARTAEALVLYTPAYGPATGTNDFGAELVLRVLEPASAPRLAQTALVELIGFGSRGNSPIPADGLVLSGHGAGAAALADLWSRHQSGAVSRRGLLRVETTAPVAESVGATPILVHEGRRWVADDGSGFVAGRHPRTIVGWNAAETLLVTVDGRQPGYSIGLSLPDAAELLRSLGATEAVNLDGGGSTTLAAGPVVLNRPSDRMVKRAGRQQIVHDSRPGDVVVGSVERPVASGLAIVPAGAAPQPPFDPLAGGVPVVLGDKVEVLPYDMDPASVPGAGNFALLDLRQPPSPSPGLIAVAAGMEVAMAQWLLVVAVGRRRRRSAV